MLEHQFSVTDVAKMDCVMGPEENDHSAEIRRKLSCAESLAEKLQMS